MKKKIKEAKLFSGWSVKLKGNEIRFYHTCPQKKRVTNLKYDERGEIRLQCPCCHERVKVDDTNYYLNEIQKQNEKE